MSSIRDAVCWSGPAVINLFTLGRTKECLQEEAFNISGERPEELEIFQMHSDLNAKELIVWEYDLTFHDVSQDSIPYLLLCLERASAGANGVAWLAFEGSFHFEHLFTEDIADQIYGYCMTGGEPVVVWDGEVLKSGGWKRRISEVKSALDSGFLRDDPR
ncbi:hypothetical protein ABZ806_25495 [Spirillospora sp. NPDC047418]